jgi:peptide-methionine (S)-S-oxide reductase
VVTYIRKFEEFYKAEDKHQDYYQEYFLNYLRYKKACRREKILNNIWGS